MIILNAIKETLRTELENAKEIWIASAMISKKGLDFLQTSISTDVLQNYLIGIDLATEPIVFDYFFSKNCIRARIYKHNYTFHPKVYIVKKTDNTLTAFVGSSNTTSWGLEKNIEMNVQINEQTECKKLIKWFSNLYDNGYIITPDFIAEYKSKFSKASLKAKEIDVEANLMKEELSQNEGQFFNRNQHKIFNKKYHRVDNEGLKKIRQSVRTKFLELHKSIYPRFKDFGLIDLHCHHQKREIVSRHYFNQYSGKYVNAMWVHYGKSHAQLQNYHKKEAKSFINNIRLQVILHEHSVGIWLVLGKDNGSEIDRTHFKAQLQLPEIQLKFLKLLKELGDEYWINASNKHKIALKNLTKPSEFLQLIKSEVLSEYFIIGCDINSKDKRLSEKNIVKTVLGEFKKLYLLYKIMRHKMD